MQETTVSNIHVGSTTTSTVMRWTMPARWSRWSGRSAA